MRRPARSKRAGRKCIIPVKAGIEGRPFAPPFFVRARKTALGWIAATSSFRYLDVGVGRKSRVFKLLLLIGTSLAPAFSFSNEDRAGHEADIFRISSTEESKATLERLIGQEPEPLRRTTSALQRPQGREVAVTTLQYGAGKAAIAYLYQSISSAEGDHYICRIRIDHKSEVGFSQTMRWCLSFIDPAYRPTVVVPSMKMR
jgi:hypothetical protein